MTSIMRCMPCCVPDTFLSGRLQTLCWTIPVKCCGDGHPCLPAFREASSQQVVYEGAARSGDIGIL
jgi:hypothetical protein